MCVELVAGNCSRSAQEDLSPCMSSDDNAAVPAIQKRIYDEVLCLHIDCNCPRRRRVAGIDTTITRVRRACLMCTPPPPPPPKRFIPPIAGHHLISFVRRRTRRKVRALTGLLLWLTVFAVLQSSAQQTQTPEPITGELIGVLAQEHVGHIRTLIDNGNGSFATNAIPGAMRSCGVIGMSEMMKRRASRFSNAVVLQYDSTMRADDVITALMSTGLFRAVYRRYPPTEIFLGCHPWKYTGHWNEPNLSTTWWIQTTPGYSDEDLSAPEAWEFTRSDPSVLIASFGGPGEYTSDVKAGPEYRELVSSITTGYDSFYNLYGFPWNNPSAYGHALTCMQVIAADHDTTANGTIGVAPDCSVVPYLGLTDAEFLTCVDDAIDKGATAFVYTMLIYGQLVQDAIDTLLTHDVLVISALGNTNTPYTNITNPGAIRVAANTGLYKTSLSRAGTPGNPYPEFSASGPFGGYTSFAASAVGGIAALLKNMHPAMSMAEMRAKLIESTTPMADALWDPDPGVSSLGSGRLDAFVAIASIKKGTIGQDETWSGPIFVPEDIYIPSGVTVTVDLTPCDNGVERTHIRFGCETQTNPPTEVRPRIIVDGTLIVRGRRNEDILFSTLLNRYIIDGSYGSTWGGIVVNPSGELFMEHARLENVERGLVSYSPRVTVRESEICNYERNGIILAPTTWTESPRPSIVKTTIHDARWSQTSTGISVWRGLPLIDSCTIYKVDVGVHLYGSMTAGDLQYSRIHDTRSCGVLSTVHAQTRLFGDTIYHNFGDGVRYVHNNSRPHIHQCYIYDNGRTGLVTQNGKRTGDAISLTQSIALAYNNVLKESHCGFHLEDYSSLYGGDGTRGLFGRHGFNYIESCDTAYYGNAHSYADIGLRKNNQSYGGSNTAKLLGMYGVADPTSVLNLQCNTWLPFVRNAFYGPAIPDPQFDDCYPQPPVYPYDSFLAGRDSCLSGNYAAALIEYGNLAFQGDPELLLLALSGYQEIFSRDSNRSYASAIDSILTTLASTYQNAPPELRGSIAAVQGHVAAELGNSQHADSTLRYATLNLTEPSRQLHAETGLLYLHLYKNHNVVRADSILYDIQSRFAGDSLIVTAGLLRRYYVDPEANSYLWKPGFRHESVAVSHPIAAGFTLHPSYPNPFSITTNVRYTITIPGEYVVLVRDLLGRHVATLHSGWCESGTYHREFSVKGLASGAYQLVMRGVEGVQTQQIILSK